MEGNFPMKKVFELCTKVLVEINQKKIKFINETKCIKI